MEDLFRRMDQDNTKHSRNHPPYGEQAFSPSSDPSTGPGGLALGITLWAIWKERNRRIFKDHLLPQEVVWEGIIQNIKETILAEKWHLRTGKVPPHEARIMQRLNISLTMIAPSSWKVTLRGVTDSLNYFTAPTEGFMKLSFDGASKGNPGPIGLGGLFRDPRTNTTLIYVDHCGYASNNEAEFVATRQGLQIAIKMGYKNIVVEGDSRLVINTVKKLNQGTKWEKLSHS
jgi:hypothetical protein